MPNCFSLTSKADIPAGAVSLAAIDERVAECMGVPVHEKYWCYDWYNAIGFRLATGGTFETIRQEFNRYIESDDNAEYYKKLVAIVDYLDENYISSAWVEIGRR